MTDMSMLERMAEAMSSVDEDEFAVRHGRTTDQYEVVRVTDPDGSADDEGLPVLFWGEREACEHVAGEMLHLARARAALEAMHEPTAAMLKAADDLRDYHDYGGWVDARPSVTWPEMVAAALAETTP